MLSVLLAATAIASTSAQLEASGLILPSSPQYVDAANHLKGIVANSLKDPESAKFGDVIVCIYTPQTKVGIVRVNARNSYGGYSGFQTLIPMETSGEQRVLAVNSRPTIRKEFEEQRVVLKLLEACEPIIGLYDRHRGGERG